MPRDPEVEGEGEEETTDEGDQEAEVEGEVSLQPACESYCIYKFSVLQIEYSLRSVYKLCHTVQITSNLMFARAYICNLRGWSECSGVVNAALTSEALSPVSRRARARVMID